MTTQLRAAYVAVINDLARRSEQCLRCAAALHGDKDAATNKRGESEVLQLMIDRLTGILK